jgi:uncharacterized membrane protein
VRARRVIGVLAFITGVIWIAQGTNLLHGSGMSGHGEWTVIGLFLAVVGVVLYAGSRRPSGG